MASPSHTILECDADRTAPSPAIAFLLSRIDYERTPPSSQTSGPFKLDRMRELLHRIGDPHVKVPCLHIAGSKGKGSTAAMLEGILRAGDHKTGLFTSPHIHRFEERIQINGEEIQSHALEIWIEQLRQVAEEMDQKSLGGPTFFELLTAAAWLEFAEQEVEIAIVEVGLGGRLDATNVCSPLACVMTSISRDHTRLLGDTHELIAKEKAGIIKPKVPVFSGVRDNGPQGVIADRCQECSAPLYEVDHDIVIQEFTQPSERPQAENLISVETPWRTHSNIDVPLPGRHQHRNAALAIAVADYLGKEFPKLFVDPAVIDRGLRLVKWPLRIETVRTEPRVVLDSAHNEASIQALIETLQDVPVGHRTVLFGTSKDKDAKAMLRLLGDAFDVIVLTQYRGNPRALPIEDLICIAQETLAMECQVESDPLTAFESRVSTAAPEDLICVTGSFFLCSEIRATLGIE